MQSPLGEVERTCVRGDRLSDNAQRQSGQADR